MKRRKTRRKKAGNTLWMFFICLLFLSAVSYGVYYFSDNTKIQALMCSGNYYYTPQQVYELAGIAVNDRSLAYPVSQLEENLLDDPLISNATVTKNGRNLSIHINEKLIVGYYVADDGGNILLAADGSEIPLKDERAEMRSLLHIPLLVDLSEDQMQQLAKEVSEHPTELSRDVLEKFAEISHWEESYDNNMLKIVMQDGNTVFTSMDSLFMMSRYQEILPDLVGENVCLQLDGTNQVINKIACEYMYLTPEQRASSRTVPKSVFGMSETETESTAANSTKDTDQQKTDEKTDETKDDEESAQDSEEKEDESNSDTSSDVQGQSADSDEQELDLNAVDVSDWEDSEYSWLYYSPSTSVYMSKNTGMQYRLDNTGEFVPLQ